jgi:carbonic anhydrase/acetyltransferase-like protein (isoleucine patch superfamily)
VRRWDCLRDQPIDDEPVDDAWIDHGAPVSAVVTADAEVQRLIVSADATGVIRRWDLLDATPFSPPLLTLDTPVTALAVVPDRGRGEVLACAGADGTIRPGRPTSPTERQRSDMTTQPGGVRVRHRGYQPQVHPSAYIAPTATLVGNVRVGPRARIMYGAVLDAEASCIDIGEATVICENTVIRASAAGRGDQPVVLDDHVFVGPHATLLGCLVGRCAYLATAATVLQTARVGRGAVVAVGGLVHAGTVLPDEFFVPPHTLAIGDPVRVLAPGSAEVPGAIREIGFAGIAFGVDMDWTDRIARYERSAEVRVEEFGAHAADELLNAE